MAQLGFKMLATYNNRNRNGETKRNETEVNSTVPHLTATVWNLFRVFKIVNCAISNALELSTHFWISLPEIAVQTEVIHISCRN